MSSPPPVGPSASIPPLRVLRTVESHLRAALDESPARPSRMDTLLAQTAAGFDAPSPARELAAATRELRDQLFDVPGYEHQCELRWHESLVTALYAARIARCAGLSASTSAIAGLLHRGGEAQVLRTIAAAERCVGATLEPGQRNRIIQQMQTPFAQQLWRAWSLPPDVVLAAVGWWQLGEFGATSRECMAVYFGHCLAVEALNPQLVTPGFAESIGQQFGFDAGALAQLRTQGISPRELLLALG